MDTATIASVPAESRRSSNTSNAQWRFTNDPIAAPLHDDLCRPLSLLCRRGCARANGRGDRRQPDGEEGQRRGEGGRRGEGQGRHHGEEGEGRRGGGEEEREQE